MLGLYALTMSLLQPLAPGVLRRRARAEKEDPDRLGERMGRASLRRPPGDLIWLHGASVGETLSFLPLVEALRHRRPDLTLLVTSGTVTAARILEHRLPGGVIHQYVPVDTPGFAKRFLAHWRPALAIFVESELWPNLLRQAKAAGVRLALLGARLSQSSAKGWAKAPGAARALLRGFDVIMAQDQVSAARIAKLGGRVKGSLDLKAAGDVLPCDETEWARLKAAVGRRRAILAASTHPGDDEIAVGLFARLEPPLPLLILAPRHPARGEVLCMALRRKGWNVARRSAGEPLDAGVQIYIADTLGEMGLLFRLADIVIMGGGFTGTVGGHNPLEPARLGRAIVAGPDTANFREVYSGLVEARGVLIAHDPGELRSQIAGLLADPVGAGHMAERAKTYAARGDSALELALEALTPLLPPAPLR